MIYLLILAAIGIWMVWHLALRASAIYGAYLGGTLFYHLGFHRLTIGVGIFLGASAVYALFHMLAAQAQKARWAAYVFFTLVCGPPFLIGFNIVFQYMRSPGQGAGFIEATMLGCLIGAATALAAFKSYQRDLAANLSKGGSDE